MIASRFGKRRRPVSEVSFAVAQSQSAAGALRLLGLVVAGGNYASLRGWIRDYALSTTHWTGQGHMLGSRNPHVPKYELSEILVFASRYRGSTDRLKRRLLEAGLLSSFCAICRLERWLELPLSLHLDHANGNRFDNRIENLRLLCPNCHSQTRTYCGRNKALKARMA
jgi:hypothetical protein